MLEKLGYDSLRILELRERATKGEVKAAYRAMSRINPDKHNSNSGFMGMSDEEAVEFFQHLNNAHSYLQVTRDNVTNTEERKKYERTNNEL
jgi:DnaJ-class molecular chaperone